MSEINIYCRGEIEFVHFREVVLLVECPLSVLCVLCNMSLQCPPCIFLHTPLCPVLLLLQVHQFPTFHLIQTSLLPLLLVILTHMAHHSNNQSSIPIHHHRSIYTQQHTHTVPRTLFCPFVFTLPLEKIFARVNSAHCRVYYGMCFAAQSIPCSVYVYNIS